MSLFGGSCERGWDSEDNVLLGDGEDDDVHNISEKEDESCAEIPHDNEEKNAGVSESQGSLIFGHGFLEQDKPSTSGQSGVGSDAEFHLAPSSHVVPEDKEFTLLANVEERKVNETLSHEEEVDDVAAPLVEKKPRNAFSRSGIQGRDEIRRGHTGESLSSAPEERNMHSTSSFLLSQRRMMDGPPGIPPPAPKKTKKADTSFFDEDAPKIVSHHHRLPSSSSMRKPVPLEDEPVEMVLKAGTMERKVPQKSLAMDVEESTPVKNAITKHNCSSPLYLRSAVSTAVSFRVDAKELGEFMKQVRDLREKLTDTEERVASQVGERDKILDGLSSVHEEMLLLQGRILMLNNPRLKHRIDEMVKQCSSELSCHSE
eukprot:TRINITY_DN140_c1_g1_i1.p1 TRINITY_DN140_c1_g1~~TRINITY_DN140_c1_g1_i1.p1  ORF type:complete len:372 (-),score=120.24 TRINITY_DN140_c1_g1_i1:121-1236(-)